MTVASGQPPRRDTRWPEASRTRTPAFTSGPGFCPQGSAGARVQMENVVPEPRARLLLSAQCHLRGAAGAESQVATARPPVRRGASLCGLGPSMSLANVQDSHLSLLPQARPWEGVMVGGGERGQALPSGLPVPNHHFQARGKSSPQDRGEEGDKGSARGHHRDPPSGTLATLRSTGRSSTPLAWSTPGAWGRDRA